MRIGIHGKNPLLHGGGGTLKLLNALVVVVDKDACDVPVAPLNEQADEPVGALRVVDNDPLRLILSISLESLSES